MIKFILLVTLLVSDAFAREHIGHCKLSSDNSANRKIVFNYNIAKDNGAVEFSVDVAIFGQDSLENDPLSMGLYHALEISNYSSGKSPVFNFYFNNSHLRFISDYFLTTNSNNYLLIDEVIENYDERRIKLGNQYLSLSCKKGNHLRNDDVIYPTPRPPQPPEDNDDVVAPTPPSETQPVLINGQYYLDVSFKLKNAYTVIPYLQDIEDLEKRQKRMYDATVDVLYLLFTGSHVEVWARFSESDFSFYNNHVDFSLTLLGDKGVSSQFVVGTIEKIKDSFIVWGYDIEEY